MITKIHACQKTKKKIKENTQRDSDVFLSFSGIFSLRFQQESFEKKNKLSHKTSTADTISTKVTKINIRVFLLHYRKPFVWRKI